MQAPRKILTVIPDAQALENDRAVFIERKRKRRFHRGEVAAVVVGGHRAGELHRIDIFTVEAFRTFIDAVVFLEILFALLELVLSH